ncbi:hypothetical protein PIB30_093108 [Stylosanthes scabra]|uniref:Putative plant transposon protein domain-containing protein n=1 Tax=Stylosanthes scabra TaxID=79078 RepID=A0ABU6VTS8_9FABA|nr:hypothetical protein [Stylosanthes scabra]
MADRKADRKRKGKAVSSSSQVVPRFKTLYHEAHFNATLSARRVLPELIIQEDESVFNPIRFQIQQRKWEKFTKPIQAVGHLMVKEFYANAWEPDKAKRKPYTYTSIVRGTDVSFAPSNIKRVLKLKKDPIPDAPSYHERKANKDYKLDHVIEDLCEVGVDWVRHRDGRPHFLRRSYLEPMTKGWRLDQQQEENRKSFEAIKIRKNRMNDQLSFLCYSNQMANEQMLFPYQNTSRQFKEMEMQGIPVTMANLAIHRQREEEMNQERMRYDQILQEAAAQQARKTNKGKTREVVPDSEEEFVSSESEEF